MEINDTNGFNQELKEKIEEYQVPRNLQLCIDLAIYCNLPYDDIADDVISTGFYQIQKNKRTRNLFLLVPILGDFILLSLGYTVPGALIVFSVLLIIWILMTYLRNSRSLKSKMVNLVDYIAWRYAHPYDLEVDFDAMRTAGCFKNL